MSGITRVAVVLAAALVGALLVGGLGRATLPGFPGFSDSPSRELPELDPSGDAGLAPAPEGPAGRAGRGGATRSPDGVVAREPRARPATLDAAARRDPAGPTGLVVPSAGIRMPVEPRGVDRRGLMSLPESPAEAGWYRWGAAPRDPRGAVVVAGHVDTAEEGLGPLARAAGLQPGARIVVSGLRRDTTYRVTSVRRVPKQVLDLPALFRRTGPPALHLVTCGGEFDPVRRTYEDNVVVVAERLS
jgi:hypothetical protein